MIDSSEGAGLEEAAEDTREGVISVAMFQEERERMGTEFKTEGPRLRTREYMSSF